MINNMSEPSYFRGVIEFFNEFGLYDVVLPFLLIFTIVFAILDKTRVFGSDKIGGETYPKKSINAIVAFTIALFVVASAHLVQVITTVSSHVIILLMASVFFLTLIGSFMKETEEGVFLPEAWQAPFMIVMLLGIVFIFLNALGWLNSIYLWLKDHWSSDIVSAAFLLLIIAGVMALVMGGKKNSSGSGGED
ncbi:MAG: hypothetical protein MAG795_01227 [Candidatus Woesearchaeota archaeon]|nr:hypothetical protein [Candidatus Woesearchaeota archaeon]